MEIAKEFTPGLISEFEVNPFVIANGTILPLDVLIKCEKKIPEAFPQRPIHKLKNLLEPNLVAIIGISEKLNPGHIILNNIIREGFDKRRIYVVKPETQSIEGCQCYPDVKSLPEKVDLLILSIAAHEVPKVIAETIEEQKAESIIVIPGGLEEKKGTEKIVSLMHSALYNARKSDWQGPVINGGNCLGIRSYPGHYNTMFIPEYKLPAPVGETSPIALISQSGAFAVSKTSKLSGLNPRYTISIGNQMDLTIGDYVTYLKDDPEVEFFAIYVEGFKPFDGLKFLKAAKEITESGRTIILYRAGRTPAGAQASASHTTSLAGDYVVTRELANHAGIIVTETLADFEDITRLFVFLRQKKVKGLRLGALSNAGFECVAMADNLCNFQLATLSQKTVSALLSIFKKCRIDEIVDVHNPIDLTPMTNDHTYEEVICSVMKDENVDVGIVGCIPLTPLLNTLPPGEGHREDVYKDDSIAMRMVKLKDKFQKAWVAVVDGGAIYDSLARLLEKNGVPTFRTADRAIRLFNIFCNEKIKKK